MADPKFQIGETVVRPNGQEATVTQRWNPVQTWGNPNGEDIWEYHVEYPQMGLGGKLNFQEDELRRNNS